MFDATLWAVERGLEALALRHQILADNVSNVETPGFKRSDVAFRGELAKALRAPQPSAARPAGGVSAGTLSVSHPRHMGAVTAGGGAHLRVSRQTGTTARADGNNVDVEYEMALMARNTLEYQTLLVEADKRLAMLRTVITEGRR